MDTKNDTLESRISFQIWPFWGYIYVTFQGFLLNHPPFDSLPNRWGKPMGFSWGGGSHWGGSIVSTQGAMERKKHINNNGLPKTNSSHLKMDGWKETLSYWTCHLFMVVLRCFREGSTCDLVVQNHWEKTQDFWGLQTPPAPIRSIFWKIKDIHLITRVQTLVNLFPIHDLKTYLWIGHHKMVHKIHLRACFFCCKVSTLYHVRLSFRLWLFEMGALPKMCCI